MPRIGMSAFVGLLISGLVLGQPVPPPPLEPANVTGLSEQTYKRLAEIERKLIDTKSAEALEDLLRLLDSAGDDLVSRPDSGTAQPARRVAQQILANLPENLLTSYRQRMDLAAQSLVDQALQARQPAALQRVLDRYFPASPCETALFWLGEFAFFEGNFRAAEEHWRRLLPQGRSIGAPFPQPRRDPATLAARIILAIAYGGELPRAREELAQFIKRFPKSEGYLAGQEGNLAEILTKILHNTQPPQPHEFGEGDWATGLGNPQRSGRVSGRLPYYWPGQPSWRVTLPPESGPTPTMPRTVTSRGVNLHPVLFEDLVCVADATRVLAYDRMSGELKSRFSIRSTPGAHSLPSDPFKTPIPDSDYTLSSGGGLLMARLGEPLLMPTTGLNLGPIAEAPPPNNYLVGLVKDPISGGLKLSWRLPPPVPAGIAASWEAAPLWHNGRLYATFARDQGNRMVISLACFEDKPGEPVWITDLVDTNSSIIQNKARHELLTLAGDHLVYCSHTGAIVAVDDRTGKLVWAYKYPKQKPSLTPVSRDLAPAVYAAGRLYVAPNDAEYLFCLDPLTGQLLWQSSAVQIDHILGVSQGKVIAAVNGPVRGLRAWNAYTGNDREPDGWRVTDDPLLASFGRGLVSQQMILWPTNAGLFFVNPADGTLLRAPLRYPHGNLSFARGLLMVGRSSEVWCYMAQRLDLPLRKLAYDDRPSPQTARDLALCHADSGEFTEALKLLDQAAGLLDADRLRAEWLIDLSKQAPRRMDLKSTDPVLESRFAPDSMTLRHVAFVTTDQRLERPGDRALSPSPVVPANRPTPSEPVLHHLNPNAVRVSTVRFPNSQWVPLLPLVGSDLPAVRQGKLILQDGSELRAFPAKSNQARWSLKLPTGLKVTHGAVVGESLLAAGPRGVLRCKLDTGELEWANLWADVDPLGNQPWLRQVNFDSWPRLEYFQLTSSRLVVLAGSRILLAYDLAHGAVAWVLNPFGLPRIARHSYPEAPQFNSCFFANDDFVIIRTNRSERWTIRTQDGRILERAPTSLTDWISAPVQLPNGEFAVADGGELIRAYEFNFSRRSAGKIVWSRDFNRPSNLSGQSAQLYGIQDQLLVGVHRNIGMELELLRSSSGDRVWRRNHPMILGESASLSHARVDKRFIYLPTSTELQCYRLEDGLRLWKFPWPESRGQPWRVVPGADSVLALPQHLQGDGLPETLQAVANRFPNNAWRLPWLPWVLYDGICEQTLPLLWLDPQTGTVQHRLSLPVGPVYVVDVGPSFAVVVSAGYAHWLN